MSRLTIAILGMAWVLSAALFSWLGWAILSTLWTPWADDPGFAAWFAECPRCD